jgi:phosphoribosylformylglycinamidine synthase
VHQTIKHHLVRSCHDLSEGGLAVAIAEMAFAGELGVELNLTPLIKQTGCSPETILFSESHSRYLLEVSPEKTHDLEAEFEHIPYVKLGLVTNSKRVRIQDHHQNWIIDEEINLLKKVWKHGIQF